MKRFTILTLVLVLFLGVQVKVLGAPPITATRWHLNEIECPLCKTPNSFYVVVAWGTYVYDWPSKYQGVFWPYTTEKAVYTCLNCRYSAFKGDFEELPKEKQAAVRAVLTDTSLPGKFKFYEAIPMSARLAIAEKVYAELGRDDRFWFHFRRVQAYHFDAEKKPREAKAARLNGFELAMKLIASEKSGAKLKEYWLLAGMMQHFAGNDEESAVCFNKALAQKYESAEAKPEENEQAEKRVNDFIEEYLKLMKSAKPPRAHRYGLDD
jgi:hypothetical protein